MKICDKGVLPQSEAYFFTRSSNRSNPFYSLNCTGHFFCDETYCVRRQSYDSFLILYVVSGRGYICTDAHEVPLPAGSFALLDCYSPHQYGTHSGWEILWIHFDGAQARSFFELCTANKQVFTPMNGYKAFQFLQNIYLSFHEKRKINEAVLSCSITELLTELYLFAGETTEARNQSQVIQDVLCMIEENIAKPLTLDEMARYVSLSPFYFMRIFKRETGFTPHEYLIQARMNRAKYFLTTSDATVKQVGLLCGFHSEAAFCTLFKKTVQKTPLQYRNDQTT